MIYDVKLDKFVKEYRLDRKEGVSIVLTKDLLRLKSAGHSIEDLLNYLSRCYGSLLHGSRTDISNDYLDLNEEGKVYCSNLAGIALMRAIISNNNLKRPGLVYPYFIDENNLLEVKIHGINEHTIGNNGFVYVVNQTESFRNDPAGSWQYVKSSRTPIAVKIAVQKADFKYPVLDITKGIWL